MNDNITIEDETTTAASGETTESGADEVEYLPPEEPTIWTNDEIIKYQLDYVPIKYAAEEIGVTESYIRNLRFKEKIDTTKTVEGRVCVSMGSLKEYREQRKSESKAKRGLAFGELKADKDILFAPLTGNNTWELFDSDMHEYDHPYLVSNTGLVFNVDTGAYLTLEINNKYHCVTLKKHGEFVHRYVHHLVAYCFCRGNSRFGVKIVHHIDQKPLNNNAKNLIYVTAKEHGELHKLLKDEDIKAYRQRIREIRKENNKWG